MSDKQGPKERWLQEMREARYAGLEKMAEDVRKKSHRARKVAEEAHRIAERIRTKSAKKKGKRK